jgi:hypothetical protein
MARPIISLVLPVLVLLLLEWLEPEPPPRLLLEPRLLPPGLRLRLEPQLPPVMAGLIPDYSNTT